MITDRVQLLTGGTELDAGIRNTRQADEARVYVGGAVVLTARRSAIPEQRNAWCADDSPGDPWLSLTALLEYRGFERLVRERRLI